MSNWLSGIP